MRIRKDFILVYQVKYLPSDCSHRRLVSTGWDNSFDPDLAVAKEHNIISESLDSEGRLLYRFPVGF